MAQLALGTRIIDLKSGWVEFNPVILKSDQSYYLEFQVNYETDIEDYTEFTVSCIFKVKGGSILKTVIPSNCRFDQSRYGLLIELAKIVDDKMPVKFLVKRTALIYNLSKTPRAKVTLSIDPDIKF